MGARTPGGGGSICVAFFHGSESSARFAAVGSACGWSLASWGQSGGHTGCGADAQTPGASPRRQAPDTPLPPAQLAAGSLSHSARTFFSVSWKIANQPMPGTGERGMMIVPPNCSILLAYSATDSTPM